MDPLLDSWPQELRHALSSVYARMNRTELYQRCRRAGLSVQANWTREAYTDALFGHSYVSEDHIIDDLRSGLIAFIDEFWQQLQAQLKCPAKNLHNPDPTRVNTKPCYTCLDMQVLACVTNLSPQNQHRLTQLRRK